MMQGLEQKVKSKFVTEFYRKNILKGKQFDLPIFAPKRIQIWSIMQLLDVGKTYAKKF